MPEVGDFVELRGRRWLVEAADPTGSDLAAIRLSCISDDAQGESLEVLWDAEIGPQRLGDDSWQQIGLGAPDSAEVLAAHNTRHPLEYGDRKALQRFRLSPVCGRIPGSGLARRWRDQAR